MSDFELEPKPLVTKLDVSLSSHGANGSGTRNDHDYINCECGLQFRTYFYEVDLPSEVLSKTYEKWNRHHAEVVVELVAQHLEEIDCKEAADKLRAESCALG